MSLFEEFTHRRNGKLHVPLDVFRMDGFELAIYPGAISELDIIIKYRQKIAGKWSKIRTPKHIHWTVDVLTKMFADKNKTGEFIDFLLRMWEETGPLTQNSHRKGLNLQTLSKKYAAQRDVWQDLGENGEYPMEFLILLAKLLMIQEKTNLREAYFFRKLLEKLKKGEDIFGIVSAAAYSGR